MPASSQALSSVPLKYAVGEGLQLGLAHRLARGRCHVAQLRAVVTVVGDLVRHDQVMPGVDA